MSQGLFLVMVLLVSVQRLLELRKSRVHERALVLRGGIEIGASHFPWMRAIHAAWLVAMVVESSVSGRLPELPELVTFAALFVVGQALRLAAMETLGPRWTARVYCVPGETLVTGGLYRHIAHPNYLGVILEIAALPMLFDCWRTSLTFSTCNALILAVRIPVETQALRAFVDQEHATHA